MPGTFIEDSKYAFAFMTLNAAKPNAFLDLKADQDPCVNGTRSEVFAWSFCYVLGNVVLLLCMHTWKCHFNSPAAETE